MKKKIHKNNIFPTKISDVKLFSWNKIVPKSVLALEKKSKAGVIADHKGVPRLFIFDTFAFLDILSKIDEELVDRLTSQDYHSKEINPAGWLIDEIESRLPISENYIASLKQAIDEAKKQGWIPFSQIERELKLN